MPERNASASLDKTLLFVKPTLKAVRHHRCSCGAVGMRSSTSTKQPCGLHRSQALTLIDTLVVIAVVSLGILALLPVTARDRSRSTRISCVNNLRQMGIAFRMWADDNQDRFPWSSTNIN